MKITKFKFNKPFLSQSELIEAFGSMSEATLKRYMKEWIDKGKHVSDMGMFRLENVRENQWCPLTFLQWIYENKVVAEYKYNYEKLEQDKLKKDLNNLQHKENKNVKH